MELSFDRILEVAGLGLAVLGIVIGIGVALAMDPKSKGEAFFSIGCFVFSGLVLCLTIGAFSFLTSASALRRILITVPLFVTVCLSTVEASRWVSRRYLLDNAAFSPENPPTTPALEASSPTPNRATEPVVKAPQKKAETVGRKEAKTQETQTAQTSPSPPSQSSSKCFDSIKFEKGKRFQASEGELPYAERLTIWPEGAHQLRFYSGLMEVEYDGPPDRKPVIRYQGNCWTGSGCDDWWITFEKSPPETLELNVYTANGLSLECIDKIHETGQ